MGIIKVRWKIDELANVMSQFDQCKVYWTASLTAPISWTEATGVGTRVDLVAGQTEYYFDHTSGDTAYYYATAYYNSSTTVESPKSDPIPGTALGYSQLEQSELPNYLTVEDLYTLVGSQRVIQFFDDDNDGSIEDEMAEVYRVLSSAEDEASGYLLRSFDAAGIVALGNNDRAFKNHVAWVALEFASERRTEFLREDGKGAFWVQYERAVKYFDMLSKGRKRSAGESEAGTSGRIGGKVQPTISTGTSRFVFAPDDDNPTGHGGF